MPAIVQRMRTALRHGFDDAAAPKRPSIARRRGILATILLAFVAPTHGSAQQGAAGAGLVGIDANSAHPVVAGTLLTEVTRPAERIEIVMGVTAQPSVESNRIATVGLLGFVRRILPGIVASAGPTTTLSGAGMQMDGGPYGGYVRMYVPGVIGDAKLRGLVSHVMGAINQLDFRDPLSSARIVSVGRGYASCAPFRALASANARARVQDFARALGSVTSSSPFLAVMPPRGTRIDGPVGDGPLCGRDEHALRPTSLELPTAASFTLEREYGFAQRMRFDAPRRAMTPGVPSFWAGSEPGMRMRVRADRPLLTVEGRASAERVVTGTAYQYTGPSGTVFRRSLSEAYLAQIRERLRALRIADKNIVTQLTPSTGQVYVGVHTDSPKIDSAVVGAIAGTDPVERGAVLTASYGDTCESETRTIARALGDAAARAALVAASLGTTVDARPVAVEIGRAPLAGCTQRTFEAGAAMARHVSGNLRVSATPEVRAVFASFRIGTPLLSGSTEARPGSDARASYAAQWGYVPPPIDYPEGSIAGSAAREVRLTPQSVQLGLDLSPDNAHAFAPIDPAFVSAFAARLGISESNYTAAFLPGTWTLPSGRRDPESLRLVAVLPYRGATTVAAADAALRSLRPVGYGGLSVLPQRRDCAREAAALARDAIRAAAAQARAPRGARVVAIDLRGPFAVDGTCRPGSPDGRQTFGVRSVAIEDVRLAAYARVSYAR